MTDDRPPWETEPDRVDFWADGLPCVMRRSGKDVWCGYVGVDPQHPLYGLPTNHLLKLPPSWFEGRTVDQGFGPMDFFMHVLSGARNAEDVWPISLAFHVHGGVNYAEDHVPNEWPGDRWWFGFDCGHAGDYVPSMDMNKMMGEMIDTMPKEAQETLRRIVRETAARTGDYRDQQYVVGECQSLAAQLIAVVGVLEKERTHE